MSDSYDPYLHEMKEINFMATNLHSLVTVNGKYNNKPRRIKMARLANLVLLMLGLLIGANANAIPITINAANYDPGTDLTQQSVNGVILQQYEHLTDASSITYSDAKVRSVGVNNDIKILGSGNDTENTNGLNSSEYDSVLDGAQSLSSASYFSGLSIKSDQVIQSIEWKGYMEPGVDFTLKLFDQNNKYISTINERYNITGSCDGMICFIGNYNLNLTGESVYRIAWSGYWDVGNLECFTVDVPEPSSLVLLSLGLLGLLLSPNARKKMGFIKTRSE